MTVKAEVGQKNIKTLGHSTTPSNYIFKTSHDILSSHLEYDMMSHTRCVYESPILLDCASLARHSCTFIVNRCLLPSLGALGDFLFLNRI